MHPLHVGFGLDGRVHLFESAPDRYDAVQWTSPCGERRESDAERFTSSVAANLRPLLCKRCYEWLHQLEAITEILG